MDVLRIVFASLDVLCILLCVWQIWVQRHLLSHEVAVGELYRFLPMALISSSVFDVATNVVELIALERGTSVVTVILIDIFQGTCVLIGLYAFGRLVNLTIQSASLSNSMDLSSSQRNRSERPILVGWILALISGIATVIVKGLLNRATYQIVFLLGMALQLLVLLLICWHSLYQLHQFYAAKRSALGTNSSDSGGSMNYFQKLVLALSVVFSAAIALLAYSAAQYLANNEEYLNQSVASINFFTPLIIVLHAIGLIYIWRWPLSDEEIQERRLQRAPSLNRRSSIDGMRLERKMSLRSSISGGFDSATNTPVLHASLMSHQSPSFSPLTGPAEPSPLLSTASAPDIESTPASSGAIDRNDVRVVLDHLELAANATAPVPEPSPAPALVPVNSALSNFTGSSAISSIASASHGAPLIPIRRPSMDPLTASGLYSSPVKYRDPLLANVQTPTGVNAKKLSYTFASASQAKHFAQSK